MLPIGTSPAGYVENAGVHVGGVGLHVEIHFDHCGRVRYCCGGVRY